MDHIRKFLLKLSSKKRAAVMRALDALGKNRLESLDVKPLTGQKNWFRCRVGDIRIIFIRTTTGTNIVYTIQFRDKAYKSLPS